MYTMMQSPPDEVSMRPIALDRIAPVGTGLHRPECVLATPTGDVFASDWRGGVTVVRSDGAQESWIAAAPGIDLKPNGIAFHRDGGFLLANLGDDGGVWRLHPDESLSPFLLTLGGRALPPTNFVYVDEEDRTWISVSTRERPRQKAWRPGFKDGFVVMVDRSGPRLVMDGLGYANEVRVDPGGEWVYVVETFARRLLRSPLRSGSPGAPEVFATFDPAFFPDGFMFDEAGGIWVTSLISNRVVRLDSSGRATDMIRDDNEAHTREAMEAYEGGRMEARHLGPIPGTRFQHLTSLSFGGADRRTAWLGSLHADRLYRFRSEVAGVEPPYWSYRLP